MTKRPQDTSDGVPTKKLDTSFTSEDIHTFFNGKIWSEKFQDEMTKEIEDSQPYRWGTIRDLMDDTLLRNVRSEVLSEIAFTKKETDIYKVFQSGDLANLSGLNWDDLSRLPSLYKLRAAIYSEQFRDVVSKVTGCGKLSGVKTDMSINTYTKGCHLLTHDDVIGSRRVSFILYLPDPDRTWKPQYGGGLRLFPAIVNNVPETDFQVKLVPQFNQIAFFTVQPGRSFHDVEEVRVDKQRLSIQGWFHIPQSGEPGFVPGEQEETESRSTLQQLQSKELQEYDFPKPYRRDIPVEEAKIYEDETSEFSEIELDYLKEYINPLYFQKTNLESLSKLFAEESVVEIKDILKTEYANELRDLIKNTELNTSVPQNSKQVHHPWKCAIPPHKQRFMYMDGTKHFDITEKSIKFVNSVGPQEAPNFGVLNLESETDKKLADLASFLKSVVFKKWLKFVTGLIVTSEQVLVRRFRPGQDFILATTTDKKITRNDDELNALLEATLNLTPSSINPKNWESGEFGGYELCMALQKNGDNDGEFEEDDDPAIYRANDPNDDSVLYTSQCKWNSLTLILRDPTVLKFIKYVSINAKGSRWDISCQWNVKDSYEDEDDKEQDE
ncbi:putative component of NuA3 histone acetyltransferase complex [Scheffersomyces stipitis CBS 6054]|uniref:uS12 prolyl 3,4-dihydroxylase n=1 Tax=Scheffersomyces stipitis (strain ATCC 58785 / CBS 6054 / NBRC 10063 / NRRL Y-11545) TaxID=322104 RepID=A3GF88_PICST|nr:Predicted component of NuA3 histone acetyltransferase complex [Scheffersomyces stipitis CBS 6054]EAZ63710.2 putative component of NuA3 histone acetyltransferase complex [Scheffersomyces stipitis CBS 6054]